MNVNKEVGPSKYRHLEIKGTAPRAAEPGSTAGEEPKFGMRVYFGAFSDRDVAYNQWKKAAHLWVRGIPQQIVRDQLGSDSADQVVGIDLALRVAEVFEISVDATSYNPIETRELNGFMKQEVMRNG